jgi:hypothetical protein
VIHINIHTTTIYLVSIHIGSELSLPIYVALVFYFFSSTVNADNFSIGGYFFVTPSLNSVYGIALLLIKIRDAPDTVFAGYLAGLISG